jgi:xanthine dehydrogenase accessory factor
VAVLAALSTPAGYLGLVASRRRGKEVLQTLREQGADEEALARVRCPAGLDLGPSTQEEIAVAILAELVAWRHTLRAVAPPLGEAVDPVCGMKVVIEEASESATAGGVRYYFCSAGCRQRFESEPARYAAEVSNK